MTIITATGTETLVNTTTANAQTMGAVTALTGGRYVVTWTDNVIIGQEDNVYQNGAAWDNAEIRGQIFNADGTKSGAEFHINTTTQGAQFGARATLLSDGNFLVTWGDSWGSFLDVRPGTPVSSIRAQEFTSVGVAVGSEFQIGAAGAESYSATITSLAGGGFMAFWQEGTQGNLVGQVYDSGNATVGSKFTVDSTNNPTFSVPRAITLANGNVVVAWINGPGASGAVSAQIFTPAGVAVGSELSFGINGAGTLASLTPLASGLFALGHIQQTSFQLGLIDIIGADGTGLTQLQIPDQAISSVPFGFDLAPLANGGLIATWNNSFDPTSDGSGTSIRALAFNGIGNEIGTAFTVNTQTAGNQTNADAALLSTGDLVVVWRDPSGTLGDASGTSIKQQVFDVNPANQNPVAVADTTTASGTSFILDAEFELLGNDTDADGDAIIVSAISNVVGGTATLNVLTQEISVTRATPTSVVTFSYTVSDGAGGTANANATVLTTRDDAVTVRGGISVIDFLANDGLTPRPEGYFVFAPGTNSPNGVNYQSFGTGLSTVMFAFPTWNFAHNGYAFLPVGQTMTDILTYSVINPSTSLLEYNATITVTLQGWTQTGTTARDALVGGAQADHLVGGTGAANELIGGAGDDWYTVEAVGDTIVELAGGGTDFVYTNLASFVMPSEVERLFYVGTGSTFAGIGNASDNIIGGSPGRDLLVGGAGNDTLQGNGAGAGNENFLIGGTGNDIYIVSVLGDSTVELADEGIDEVRTSLATYALQANIENLTFSAGNIPHAAGVGNALDNVITGASAYDELFGLAGNDTLRGGSTVANAMLGGAGDDLYVATAVGDSIIEMAGEGTDSVQTSNAIFTLRANVENLTYTGAAAFTGIGNAEANSLTGGVGADFLSGLDGADILTGGSGADELLGGAGADQFRYTGTETGVDRIFDFTAGSDKIALSTTGYTHTAVIGFIQGAGATATEAVSTFLYDTVTGMVSFDADGNGAGAAVQIAQLNAGLSLSPTDFVFY